MARICKVLVIEDHAGIRAVIGDALGKNGYRFTLFASGQGAREAIETEKHDIAIIDVPLANDDAVDLAAFAGDAGMGVILTAADHQAFAAGPGIAHRHLLKPFQIDQVLRLIDEILRDLAIRCVRSKSRGSSVGSISRG